VKFFSLIFKNLWRNKIRTILTALAVFTLVAIFSMIFSVIRFLDLAMTEKSRDIKLILTEKYRIPSRFDLAKMKSITESGELAKKLEAVPGYRPEQNATWTFIAATLDPEMKDRDKFFLCIATQPRAIPVMVEGLEGFNKDDINKIVYPPLSNLPNQGMLMGPDRMKKLGVKVGDRLKALAVNFRSGKTNQVLEIEPEIVGTLPGDSRWADGAFIDVEYLNRRLDAENCPLANKVNLGWLMVDDKAAADAVTAILARDALLKDELKIEEASSAVTRFLEPLKDLLWGVKWLLMPAILIVMTVIIANAISITVRERVREIGVLKVLGFRRGQILTLILGEGLLLGVVAGVLSGLATIFLVNYLAGGIKLPLGFFPVFFVPWHAVWWGALLGAGTAFLGGILPVWNGVSVKVSEIFAKVA
jgi:putative ABC transport system permease protein